MKDESKLKLNLITLCVSQFYISPEKRCFIYQIRDQVIVRGALGVWQTFVANPGCLGLTETIVESVTVI